MTEEHSITVVAAESGQRLDAYLTERIEATSRAQIQRAIESGDITVNDADSKASYKVRPGDEIHVEIPPSLPLEAAAEDIRLNILFEDDHLIVINKPAGMVVHPGAGITSGTLANALVHHFGQLTPGADRLRPGVVHRLDVGTSGLIVVAKTDNALQRLSEQFAERQVRKAYIALVFGTVTPEQGKIDDPIGRDPHHRVKMSVRPPGSGRTALTHYRVRERFPGFTLLDVEIKTGRTHQIRVHLAHLRYPVVGDTGYDNGRGKNFSDSALRGMIAHLGRPFLHAASLAFTHPKSGEPMSFELGLPVELLEVLERLRQSGRKVRAAADSRDD
ncbi:MAG: RluA family pseudouridine synthase [Acidobacteriota bacterium]